MADKRESSVYNNNNQNCNDHNYGHPYRSVDTDINTNVRQTKSKKICAEFDGPLYKRPACQTKHVIDEKRQKTGSCCLVVSLVFGIISLVLSFLSARFSLTETLMTARLQMPRDWPTFGWWENPEPIVTMRVFLFAVTNADTFLSGQDKILQFEEIGPIVYREHLHHTNIVHNQNNSTLSYTATRTVEFLDYLNEPGILNRTIIVPNFVTLGFASYLHDALFFSKMAFNMLLRGIDNSLFFNTTVYDYFWNVRTPVSEAVRNTLPFLMPLDNMGVLETIYENFVAHVNVNIGQVSGLNNNFFSINTYEDGKASPTFRPKNGDCIGAIANSTEGVLYPQNMNKDSIIYYWRQSICRPVPLHFEKEVQKGSLLAYKFQLRTDAFDRLKNRTADCYRGSSGYELPDGASDMAKCYHDFPLVVSSPHFLDRPSAWTEKISGFTPDVEKHGSFIILEPRTGVPIEQCARSQSNVVIPNIRGFSKEVERFSEMIIPMFWIEYYQQNVTTSIEIALILCANILPNIDIFLPPLSLLVGMILITFALLRALQRCNCNGLRKTHPKINNNIVLSVNEPLVLAKGGHLKHAELGVLI